MILLRFILLTALDALNRLQKKPLEPSEALIFCDWYKFAIEVIVAKVDFEF